MAGRGPEANKCNSGDLKGEKMLSNEFKAAVASGDLLLTKIMIKDSVILDPSGNLTIEMWNYATDYAKKQNWRLQEGYDGGQLESNSDKWNQDVLNLELVEWLNNFSKLRMEHLLQVAKKVIQKPKPILLPLTASAQKRIKAFEEIEMAANKIAGYAREAQKLEKENLPSKAEKKLDDIDKTREIIRRKLFVCKNTK